MRWQASWMLVTRALPLCAALALLCGSAFAEKADKTKPMILEANSAKYDDAKKVMVAEGAVVVTKGSMTLRAAKLEQREDPKGNQFFVASAPASSRVVFRQKREGYDEFVEGEAQQIDYDSKADTLKLSGNAVMRKLRGSTVTDESKGHLIVFNNATETMSIEGAPASLATNRTATQPQSGRVRMMLSPRLDESAAASPSGNVPMPQLQPTFSTKP